VFHFKQFSVSDNKSTMKVGTDAVLLGIEAGKFDAENVLDVGTGCGIVALLIAQQTNAFIDAIDIDQESCIEAAENFSLSPWKNRLNAVNSDFICFSEQSGKCFDLIVSNPPFFSSGEQKKDERIGRARHSNSLDFLALTQGASKMMNKHGTFIVILPKERLSEFNTIALQSGLYPISVKIIHPIEGKKPKRCVAAFGKEHVEKVDHSNLTIRSHDLAYTHEFKKHVYDFYLDLL